MILAIITLASAASGSTFVPMPPLQTLQSETADAYRLGCTVADRNWKRFRVELLQDGGRAYLAPKDDRTSAIFRTEYFLRFGAEETGKLAGMTRFEKLVENPGYGYSTKQVELSGHNGRALVKVSEVSADEFAINIVRVSGAERDVFAGFCDVTKTRQAPLTDAETKEVVSR